jgi:hypothetical protein
MGAGSRGGGRVAQGQHDLGLGNRAACMHPCWRHTSFYQLTPLACRCLSLHTRTCAGHWTEDMRTDALVPAKLDSPDLKVGESGSAGMLLWHCPSLCGLSQQQQLQELSREPCKLAGWLAGWVAQRLCVS